LYKKSGGGIKSQPGSAFVLANSLLATFCF
jgi:hypothetical protein